MGARVVRVRDLMQTAMPPVVVWPPVVADGGGGGQRAVLPVVESEPAPAAFYMGQVEAVLSLERSNMLTKAKALKAIQTIMLRYEGGES